jgi:hypothetical protein
MKAIGFSNKKPPEGGWLFRALLTALEVIDCRFRGGSDGRSPERSYQSAPDRPELGTI